MGGRRTGPAAFLATTRHGNASPKSPRFSLFFTLKATPGKTFFPDSEHDFLGLAFKNNWERL